MTPPARVQAAIECLDAIIVAARDQGPAADTLIARYFTQRRYAGSKDRRAVRAHVYGAIRLLGERPQSGRAAMLALAATDPEIAGAFGGEGHAPPVIGASEQAAVAGIAPEWLVAALRASGIDDIVLASLLDRAPLDLRINTLKADPASVRIAFPEGQLIGGLSDALRLPPDSAIDRSEAFESGLVEVQDAGSQRVSLASGAGPGMAVIDLCAGGGGKTLALAAMMQNQGRILATDTDRARLSRLPARAARAGVTIAGTLLLDPGREVEALVDWQGRADIVLIDAPCSGTGTWRRNPEARWRLTPERIDRLAVTQSRLLDLAATLVRPGGSIAYIVCSLLDAEGKDQVDAFLERTPGWRSDPAMLGVGTPHPPGARLDPHHHSTDGFFVAKMRAP